MVRTKYDVRTHQGNSVFFFVGPLTILAVISTKYYYGHPSKIGLLSCPPCHNVCGLSFEADGYEHLQTEEETEGNQEQKMETYGWRELFMLLLVFFYFVFGSNLDPLREQTGEMTPRNFYTSHHNIFPACFQTKIGAYASHLAYRSGLWTEV